MTISDMGKGERRKGVEHVISHLTHLPKGNIGNKERFTDLSRLYS